MASTTSASLSAVVQAQLNSPSPIRQIMKMADRQNILAMGLDPANVFRQAYLDVVSDPALFHQSGAYTATLGEMSCWGRRLGGRPGSDNRGSVTREPC